MEYEYAYMLSIMSIAIAYSVFTPIILISALLYLCIKHVTDRYILYFIYGHKSIPRSILTSDMHSHHKVSVML